MTGFLVIKSYFKKSRLQTVVILIMIVLAAMLMGLTFVLGFDYHENYYRIHKELNAEHIAISFLNPTGVDENKLINALDNDERIAEYEITEGLFESGSCKYGEEGILFSNFTPISIENALNRNIGKFEILEETNYGDGYLPYIFKANNFCSVGDEFTINIGKVEFSFIIKGFYNNITTGTVNCHRNVAILFTENKYNELVEKGLTPCYRVSIKVNDTQKIEVLESEFIDELSESDNRLVFTDSVNSTNLYSTRYISELIFVGVLSAAAIVIITVLLSIIAVSLSNYIKENMKNLGIMKAMGYVSKNLIIPIILSLVILCIVMSIIGYSLSYIILPMVNRLLEAQSGIPYKINFVLGPGLITIGILTFLVCVISVLSMLKIRKIMPILAIRPHKNKESSANVFPLKNTRLNINVAIGLKQIFLDIKKFVVFFISSCLITSMLCVAAYCYDSILNQPNTIIRYTVGNIADVLINMSTKDEEKFIDTIAEFDCVRDNYVFTRKSVFHVGGGMIDVSVCDSECYSKSEYLICKGFLPKSDSEIAVNFIYANKYDLNIGDDITLKISGNEKKYTVCGFIQDSTSSGKNITMTREGFEKLSNLSTVTYLVNIEEGKDIDEFINELSEKMPSINVNNYKRYITGMSAIYINMINLLVIVIILISIIISILVLSIIVNIIIFNKRREYGILKSLGFVTRQIMFQLTISFVPVAICGSIIGLIISRDNIARLFSMFVRNIGIASFGNSICIPYLIICGVVFSVFTLVVTWLLSIKIRKTVPHDLFNNE